jgi:hypothetical protein
MSKDNSTAFTKRSHGRAERIWAGDAIYRKSAAVSWRFSRRNFWLPG